MEPTPHEKERQKELGAFYTPREMAALLVDWALRSPRDQMIDPSFGGLIFLEEGIRRLEDLSASRIQARRQVWGVDVDELAHERVATAGLGLPEDNLIHADFFEVEPDQIGLFDANIGNPPYVRYQEWDDEKGLAAAACASSGVELSGVASLWAPFIVHGCRFLKTGGRLAQVLPAELLFAQYAKPVLSYLKQNFRSVKVAVFDELVFPGALEEVVLLFADDFGGSCDGFTFISSKTLDELTLERIDDADEVVDERSFKRALVASEAKGLLRTKGTRKAPFVPLGDLAIVNIGIVTGANRFFILTDSERSAHGIPPEATRMILTKAVDAPGTRLTKARMGGDRAGGPSGPSSSSRSRDRSRDPSGRTPLLAAG